MKRPGFSEGVIVALAAALLGSMMFTVMPVIVGLDITLRLTVAALGLGYMLYLLKRSSESTGRIVTLTLWLLISGIAWLVVADPLIYLALHLGMIWLVRTRYHQPGPLAALLDLGLNLLASIAAVWAFVHADSVFLGIWSFFLVQALFVAIPAADGRQVGADRDEPARPDRFQQAHRSAEAALRKLSAIN